MVKLVVSAALLAVASPALAGEGTSSPFRFQADGATFSGVRTEEAGIVTLRGQEQGGKSFRLRVKDNHVTGTFGANPVSFPVPARSFETAATLR